MRRLDYETVADCMPEDDRKLLTHIRKEQTRKQRKKGESEEGSMVGQFALLLDLWHLSP